MLVHPIDGINIRSVATVVTTIGVIAFLFRGAAATSATVLAATLVMAVSAFICVHMFTIKASITDDSLVIGGGLYTVRVHLHQVLPNKAVLAQNGGVPGLSWRTNGIGIPGLSLGWFRTRGGERVFGAVTDFRRAVLLPTSLGYNIIVSPRNPEQFLADLRRQQDGVVR